jgi:protein O-mannosyl-transferase
MKGKKTHLKTKSIKIIQEYKYKGFEKGFWRKNIIAALIIFIAGLGLYISTVKFEYVLDDKIVITDNTYTNMGIKGIKKIFSEESFTGYFQTQKDLVAGSRYRPLSIATFAIEMQYFHKPKQDGYGNILKHENGKELISGNPAISHAINALLYALTGLLLFRILCLMFPFSQKNKWFISVPFIAALLFVVHPIHTEVIANIKGRDEILSLLFSLSSLYYAFRYINSHKTGMLLMSSICYFLGLLSKENTLSFLIIIPLTIYYFTTTKKEYIFRITIPLAVVTFIYLIIRYMAVGFIVGDKIITDIMNNPFYGMSFAQKTATIFYTLGLYIKLLFIPYPLTHDYYPYTIPVMSFSDWQTILSILVYVILGVIAFAGIGKKKTVSYCILFYFITLLIVSNIVLSVGTFMNERFVYMSSIGFCILISYLLIEKIPQLISKNYAPIRNVSLIIISLVIIVFSIETIVRVPAWKNYYTLYDADIVTSKNSCWSNCFMGVGLYYKYKLAKDDETKKQLIKRADDYLQKSLKINPNYESALHMLTGVAAEEFKYDKDADKLLNTFTDILGKRENSEFIDKYLAWMDGQRIYKDKLLKFFQKTGYDLFFKQKPNMNKAKKYIQMGLQLDANDFLLQSDLKEINKAGAF